MKDKKLYMLTFSMVVAFCIVCFGLNGAYPFDDKSIMICDGIHQYVAFYERLWTMVTGQWIQESLFYTEFFGLFAYYLASPFSLLILLLRCFMNMNEAVSIGVILKIGLSGATFAWYLSKRSTLCWEWIPALSCMYALSDYILGYYTNLMWLDAVILLPILAYELEEFAANGKWKRYYITLLGAIIINYYTGYMLGMFSVLYFGFLAIKKALSKDMCVKFVKKTVLCVAASLCWLIPVAISLSKTSAGKALQGAEGIFCGNPFYLFHRMSYTAIPVTTTQNQGDANLFCGSIVIVLLILFLLNKKINKREKKARFLLLGIYVSGLWISPLNLLFHGFHKPIGIPNRFSFIIIFLMLQIAVRSLEEISGSAKKEIFMATGCGLVVIVTDMLFVKSWISLLSFLIVLYFGIVCCKARSSWKKIWNIVLILVLILDIFSHASYGISMKRLTGRNILISRSEAIEKLLERKDDLEAYRTVLASPKVRNEEMLNNLNGMSLFCSTVPADVLLTMKKLGIFIRTNTEELLQDTSKKGKTLLPVHSRETG